MSCRVVIDEERCIANGDCADLAPSVFAVDEIAEQVGDGPRELLCAAAAACPSHAITVFDAQTGEQLYP